METKKEMIIHDVVQGTPEWHAVRCGKVSASRFSDVMAKGRGNAESKTRSDYLEQLIDEIVDGEPALSYTNADMQWGIEHEAEARQAYANETGNEIVQVGFVELNERVGCSPDGLVGDDGLVEIKCPKSKTHRKYITENRCPPEYYKQIQGQMWVTGRLWCDFFSYNPRPRPPYEHLRTFLIRVTRDDVVIAEITDAVDKFIEELQVMINRLQEEF